MMERREDGRYYIDNFSFMLPSAMENGWETELAERDKLIFCSVDGLRKIAFFGACLDDRLAYFEKDMMEHLGYTSLAPAESFMQQEICVDRVAYAKEGVCYRELALNLYTIGNEEMESLHILLCEPLDSDGEWWASFSRTFLAEIGYCKRERADGML